MITMRLTTDVKADRRVELTLPPEVPTGQAELVITVESPQPNEQQTPMAGMGLTPAQLRRMPREARQAILALAAEKAEQDYHFDKELTSFDAFSEEELDDD